MYNWRPPAPFLTVSIKPSQGETTGGAGCTGDGGAEEPSAGDSGAAQQEQRAIATLESRGTGGEAGVLESTAAQVCLAGRGHGVKAVNRPPGQRSLERKALSSTHLSLLPTGQTLREANWRESRKHRLQGPPCCNA